MVEEENKAIKKATKDEWKVQLVLIDETQPSKKYIVKGEETLDQTTAMAKILNELEKLNEALLN